MRADDIETLDRALRDARARSLALIADLSDEQLENPPRLDVVNPMLWEIGHVAWFQERWCCRRGGEPSLLARSDALFDSIAIPWCVRWDLPLPDRAATLWYVEAAHERARAHLREHGDDAESLFHQRFALAHEDMHGEAFCTMRQVHGWNAPSHMAEPAPGAPDRAEGDAEVPGGTWVLGGGDGFKFDNERPPLEVEVAPFWIARAAVTEGEFLEFVEAGGYRRDEFWSEAGLGWRRHRGREAPRYWVRDGSTWLRREFDRLVPLDSERAVSAVCFYEAEAYCRFAGRRLPTEAEWEMAALFDPNTGTRRRHPWGDAAPDAETVHGDGAAPSPCSVHAHAAGDAASGCRQMLGNVWEWTADWFLPHPGFEPDPYIQYSMPAFGFARVLKGGSFLTRFRLANASYRNFYPPHRDDVMAGFRTCARDDA